MRNEPARVIGYVTATGERLTYPKPKTLRAGAYCTRTLREHEIELLLSAKERFEEGRWDEFDETFDGPGLDKLGWR